MATEPRTGKAASARTWALRALVTVLLGLAIGAGGAVIGVRTLEPGQKEQPDSLQLMLDSIAAAPKPVDPRALRRASDSSDADQRAKRIRDSIELEHIMVTIPDVAGQHEGDARTMLQASRFRVGNVEFENAPTVVGTVVRTVPAAGQAISPNRPITLVLSNGKVPTTIDTSTVRQR